MLDGASEIKHRPRLEWVMRVKAGKFIDIPAGVPHQPSNPADRPVRAVISRTDPMEHESVVLLDRNLAFFHRPNRLIGKIALPI